MKIARLHYITQEGPNGESHLQMMEKACLTGVNWVQLRIKGLSDEEYLTIANEAVSIANKFGATLIINDNVKVALESGAHGVHVGKSDMSVAEARIVLGDDKIIGGTANDLDTIKELISAGADYIGLGPYRYTSTKQDLSPVLGIDGYRTIMEALRSINSSLPVIAIGGIRTADVSDLLDNGVHGVAVASEINDAIDRVSVVEGFYNELLKWKI